MCFVFILIAASSALATKLVLRQRERPRRQNGPLVL